MWSVSLKTAPHGGFPNWSSWHRGDFEECLTELLYLKSGRGPSFIEELRLEWEDNGG